MRHLGASVVSEMWEKQSLMRRAGTRKEKGNSTHLSQVRHKGRGILGAPDVDGLGRAAHNQLVEWHRRMRIAHL